MGRDVMASELRKARERIQEQKQFINECMSQYNAQQKRACDAEAEIERLREALEQQREAAVAFIRDWSRLREYQKLAVELRNHLEATE